MSSLRGSAARAGFFLAGRAREVLRKLRNEVLPDERAPIIRMLGTVSFWTGLRAKNAYLNGVGSFRLLTRRGLLMVLTALLA